jgi:hypothetical protein
LKFFLLTNLGSSGDVLVELVHCDLVLWPFVHRSSRTEHRELYRAPSRTEHRESFIVRRSSYGLSTASCSSFIADRAPRVVHRSSYVSRTASCSSAPSFIVRSEHRTARGSSFFVPSTASCSSFFVPSTASCSSFFVPSTFRAPRVVPRTARELGPQAVICSFEPRTSVHRTFRAPRDVTEHSWSIVLGTIVPCSMALCSPYGPSTASCSSGPGTVVRSYARKLNARELRPPVRSYGRKRNARELGPKLWAKIQRS